VASWELGREVSIQGLTGFTPGFPGSPNVSLLRLSTAPEDLVERLTLYEADDSRDENGVEGEINARGKEQANHGGLCPAYPLDDMTKLVGHAAA